MTQPSDISRRSERNLTRGAITRIFLRLVNGYQYLTAERPPICRYVPSCSNYALDALEGHGAIQGSWLVARRLIRCNPWGGKGWDPVPPNVNQTRSGETGDV